MENNFPEYILKKYIGKDVSIFVRYGFKKKIEESQSYEGKLINVGKKGIIIEREIDSVTVHDFFPWHNIDAIRHRKV